MIQRARHNAMIPFFKRGGSKGSGLTSGFVISVPVTSVSASVSIAVGSGDGGSATSYIKIIMLCTNIKRTIDILNQKKIKFGFLNHVINWKIILSSFEKLILSPR